MWWGLGSVLDTAIQFPEPSLRDAFISEKTGAQISTGFQGCSGFLAKWGPGPEGATFSVETGKSSVDLVAKSARPPCVCVLRRKI